MRSENIYIYQKKTKEREREKEVILPLISSTDSSIGKVSPLPILSVYLVRYGIGEICISLDYIYIYVLCS